MRVSHVFDFWECVPRNLASGVAPLRAYRKTIQVRLKFRSIRSPEAPRKSIQPEGGQNSVLVSGWIFHCILELLSGTNRPSGLIFLPDFLYTCFNLIGPLLCCVLNTGFSQFAPKPKSFFLSLIHLLQSFLSIKPRV